MIVKLGGKKLEYSDMLEEGWYPAKVTSIALADKTVIGSVYMDRIQLELKLKVESSWVRKNKYLLVSNKPTSELNKLVNNFQELLLDENGEVDLQKLVGLPCKVSVIHNTSKSGNIFANIGEIKREDELDE